MREREQSDDLKQSWRLYFATFLFICPPSREAEEAVGAMAWLAGQGRCRPVGGGAARGSHRPAGAA